jgi:hypothetical protein
MMLPTMSGSFRLGPRTAGPATPHDDKAGGEDDDQGDDPTDEQE